ncbi:hypothetical protein HYALB_00012679 [Hymenoscyphus albidus]|uniref:Uncharacterized protein n=1 Tax=Hymenoscyphus albidus TaxID=595503 RepID=A0A9N9LQ67_9HELO|nr:hypothetical protein HYALB_00012679 [Hymenoscyphus albidus]
MGISLGNDGKNDVTVTKGHVRAVPIEQLSTSNDQAVQVYQAGCMERKEQLLGLKSSFGDYMNNSIIIMSANTSVVSAPASEKPQVSSAAKHEATNGASTSARRQAIKAYAKTHGRKEEDILSLIDTPAMSAEIEIDAEVLVEKDGELKWADEICGDERVYYSVINGPNPAWISRRLSVSISPIRWEENGIKYAINMGEEIVRGPPVLDEEGVPLKSTTYVCIYDPSIDI